MKKIPTPSKSKYKLWDVLVLIVILIISTIMALLLSKELFPLFTMHVQSKGIDMARYGEEPIRIEIISDFDKLAGSRLARDKVLNLTINEKPDILIFMGKIGERGDVQKKILSFFYLLSRFHMMPEKIFIIPNRNFYETLISDTKTLLYYIDFFKNLEAEVIFEGIEEIRDSIKLIMASSVDRLEFTDGDMPHTIVILSDNPAKKLRELSPILFVCTEIPGYLLNTNNIIENKKGILLLNLY